MTSGPSTGTTRSRRRHRGSMATAHFQHRADAFGRASLAVAALTCQIGREDLQHVGRDLGDGAGGRCGENRSAPCCAASSSRATGGASRRASVRPRVAAARQWLRSATSTRGATHGSSTAPNGSALTEVRAAARDPKHAWRHERLLRPLDEYAASRRVVEATIRVRWKVPVVAPARNASVSLRWGIASSVLLQRHQLAANRHQVSRL